MVKQVIVWRKDLKVRNGKFGAQVSHASVAWLANRLKHWWGYNKTKDGVMFDAFIALLTSAEQEWIKGSFAKIVCQVENEEQLMMIYEKAKTAGLETQLITDLGKTEFKEPTRTCLAIGPDYAEKIDAITGELKLF